MKDKDYMDKIKSYDNNELVKQYNRNKKRKLSNNAFLGAVAIVALFIFPPCALATLGVSAFRTYHINKNNESIEKETEYRDMVLRKTRR